MEQSEISFHNNVETAAAMLENLGGCCEGTVFTFTSASSNGRFRPRLNKYKASSSSVNFQSWPIKEEPTDSVFTEMRMMARQGCETNAFTDLEQCCRRVKWVTVSTPPENYSGSGNNNSLGDESGDVQSYRRVRKLVAKIWPEADQSHKTELSTEAGKIDQVVMHEEHISRKSKKYLKSDGSSRDRQQQKYVESEKSNNCCAWEEEIQVNKRESETSKDGSQKCNNTTAEERRNKRDFRPEEIHVFEQRKVKCARRKEHDTCSQRYEATQIESFSSKTEGVQRVLNGFDIKVARDAFENKLAPTQEASVDSVTADAYLGEKSSDGEMEPVLESTKEGIEGTDLNCLFRRKVGGQFHYRRGYKASSKPRPELEQGSTIPFACSFISLKPGFPRTSRSERRRFYVAGDGCLRNRPSFNVKYQGAGTKGRKETQPLNPAANNNKLFFNHADSEIQSVHHPKRNETAMINLTYSSTRSAQVEGRDDRSEATNDRAEELPSSDRLQSTPSCEQSYSCPCDAEADRGHHVHTTQIEARRHQDRKDEAFMYPLRRLSPGGAKEFECENSTISALGGSGTSCWEGVSNKDDFKMVRKNEAEKKSEIGKINASGGRPRKGAGVSSLGDGLGTRLLDWYGSNNLDKDLEISSIEEHDDQSERDAQGDVNFRSSTDECFTSVDRPLDEHGPANVPKRLHYDSKVGQKAEVEDSSSSKFSSKLAEEMDEQTAKDKAQCVKSETFGGKKYEAEEFSKRIRLGEVSGAGVPTKNQSNESWSQRSEKLEPDEDDTGPLVQDGVPFRRQAWVKGRTRQTLEKVGYFESWIGRGKKDIGPTHNHKTSLRKKGGLIRDEISQVIGGLGRNDRLLLGQSLPLQKSSEHHSITQASSVNEGQAIAASMEFKFPENSLENSESSLNTKFEKAADRRLQTTSTGNKIASRKSTDPEGRLQESEDCSMSETPDSESDVSIAVKLAKDEFNDLNFGNQKASSGRGEKQRVPESERHFHHLPPDQASKSHHSPTNSTSHGDRAGMSQSLSLTNSNSTRLCEARQEMQNPDDFSSSPPGFSSKGEGIYLKERQFIQSPDGKQEYSARTAKVVESNQEVKKDYDLKVFSGCKENQAVSVDNKGLDMTENCGFVFEKRLDGQSKRIARANASSAVVNPCPGLTGLRDEGKDAFGQSVLECQEVDVEERSTTDALGALATEISDALRLDKLTRLEAGHSSRSVLVVKVESERNVEKATNTTAATAMPAKSGSSCQRLPKSIKHEKQVEESSLKKLGNGSDDEKIANTQKVGSTVDNRQVTCSGDFGVLQPLLKGLEGTVESDDSNVDCTLQSTTTNPEAATVACQSHLMISDDAEVRALGVDCRLPKSMTQSDSKTQLPSRTAESPPSVKEFPEDGMVKDVATNNRRHKMPIIVRVRNRFANGWLLQHPLWKRVAKHKIKAGDCPLLANKSFNQKEKCPDPLSNTCPSQGSVVTPLQGANPIGTEIMVDKTRSATTVQEEASTTPRQFNLELSPQKAASAENVIDVLAGCGQSKLEEMTSKQSDLATYDSVELDRKGVDKNHGQARSFVGFVTQDQTRSEKSLHLGSSKVEASSSVIIGTDQRDRCLPDAERICVIADDGGEVVPPVCFVEVDRRPAEHPRKLNGCSEDEHITESNFEMTKSSSCQTEPLAEATVSSEPQKEGYLTTCPPLDLFREICGSGTGEGAASERSYLSYGNPDRVMQKHGSINDGRLMHMLTRREHSVDGEQQGLAGSVDKMYFSTEIKDILEFLPVDSKEARDSSAPPLGTLRQESSLGQAVENQHTCTSNSVPSFDRARVASPFCPPLVPFTTGGRGTDPFHKVDASYEERGIIDLTRQGRTKQGPEESLQSSGCSHAGAARKEWKHWDLADVIENSCIDGNQAWPGQKAKGLSSFIGNHEHVCMPSKPKKSWNSSSRENCDRAGGATFWRDEPLSQRSSSTEEQIFLDRFSPTCSGLPNGSKHLDTTNGLPGSSILRSEPSSQSRRVISPAFSSQTSLLTAPEELCRGKPPTFLGMVGEPAPRKIDPQSIKPLHPNTPPEPQFLRESGRPDSSTQREHCEEFNACDCQSLRNHAGSMECTSSPGSSTRTESLDISERSFSRVSHQHRERPNKKWEHQEVWCGHPSSEEFHDWKSSFSAPVHLPSCRKMPVPNVPFIPSRQNPQSNLQQDSGSSHTSGSTTPCRGDHCQHACNSSASRLLSCLGPTPLSSGTTLIAHDKRYHWGELCHFVATNSSTAEPQFQKSRGPGSLICGCGVQCSKPSSPHPYNPLQVTQTSDATRSCPCTCSHSHQLPLLPFGNHTQFGDKSRQTHVSISASASRPSSVGENQKGLIWLSEDEINLIQQMRLSGDKRAVDYSKWRRTAKHENESKSVIENNLLVVRERLRHSTAAINLDMERRKIVVPRLQGIHRIAVAVCNTHDAATCIQRNWRNYLQNRKEDLKMDEGRQVADLSNDRGRSAESDDLLQHCNMHRIHTSLQDLGNGNSGKRPYTAPQRAACTIQRAWRSTMRRNMMSPAARVFPKTMKEFYDDMKKRRLSSGCDYQSFDIFCKAVKRIQAATEGSRVRRRLKSRRLQTIIVEIKEIRMLLCEMSQEASCDSTAHLFPQLCAQLHKKILQLSNALNGQEADSRFLLRRSSATLLDIQPSRATSTRRPQMQQDMFPIQKLRNPSRSILTSTQILPMIQTPSAIVKLASPGLSKPQKFYNPPLTNSEIVISDNRTAVQRHPPLIQTQLAVTQSHSTTATIESDSSKGREITLGISSPNNFDSGDLPDSAKLLPWHFVAQRSPSKRTRGQGTPIDFIKTGAAAATVMMDPGDKSVAVALDLPSQSGSPKSQTQRPEYRNTMNKSFDDLPLPLPQQRRKVTEILLEEMAKEGNTNKGMYMMEYEPSTGLNNDKPKRPFLKRKSVIMPSQKLDWSKVKPMVSSRLEPELKTKLSCCKAPTTKEPSRSKSKTTKANYSTVKSRLFSYADNVSPSASGEGTLILHSSRAINSRDSDRDRGRDRDRETAADRPPTVLRGSSSRNSSVEGVPPDRENGRNSRALANHHDRSGQVQRAASHDRMHLRRCMAEADGSMNGLQTQISQSMLNETQRRLDGGGGTYSSRFNSARYLPQPDNSELLQQQRQESTAVRGSLGSRQQQHTQRIRLRILPRSMENNLAGVLVEEIDMQEQMRELLGGPTSRPQSRSHRYAMYEESAAEDEIQSRDVVSHSESSSNSMRSRVDDIPQDNFGRRVYNTFSYNNVQDPFRSKEQYHNHDYLE